MANQLKREKDWSPLCEACLSRTKSVMFRVTILDRAKPLKYDVRTDELVSGCVVCSLVVRQLNYRKPTSASEFSVAGVSILGAGPSNIHLSVNNSYSLNLYLFTRPGGNIVISSCRDYPNLLQMIPRQRRLLQHTKMSIHLGPGVKPVGGYQVVCKAIIRV